MEKKFQGKDTILITKKMIVVTLSPSDYNGKQPGNPALAVEVMIDLAHGTGSAAGKTLPITICLGSDSYSVAKEASENALKRLEEWKDVSYSTDFKE